MCSTSAWRTVVALPGQEEEGRVEARLVDVMQKGEGGQWIREGRGKP